MTTIVGDAYVCCMYDMTRWKIAWVFLLNACLNILFQFLQCDSYFYTNCLLIIPADKSEVTIDLEVWELTYFEK
jgi:hypothetical protein